MSLSRINRPLASLRFLAIGSVALPLAVFALFAVYRYQQLIDVAEFRVNRSLRVAHEHALKVLDGAESLQDRVLDLVEGRSLTELRKQEAVLHARLSERVREKGQIQSVWIIGADGFAVASSRMHPVPKVSFTDRAYFKFHQTGEGRRYLSAPLTSRTTGERVVDISVAFKGPDGRFGGIVNVSLQTAYFQKFHSDLVADEPGLAVNMLRETGEIYTRWPAMEKAPERLADNSPVMTRMRAGEVAGDIRGVSSVDDRDRLISFRKVGPYPMYMGAGMDMTAVKKAWLGELGWLLAFGIPLVAGMLFSIRMASRRTRDALVAAEQLSQESLTRKKAEEALLQAQKLEALGRLTGGVAHDFNNALMVITNNIFLLKRTVPQAVGPQLSSISRAAESATKLTRQLLAFSRRQPLVPEYLRLQDKLPAVVELVSPVLGSNIKVSVEVADDTLAIVVDPAELDLSLLNLGINARDAMPTGGSFTITACNASAEDIPVGMKAPVVLIEAADTGGGMEPAVLEKAFEPFFTTKPTGQGTGLGLSQVYGLCQRAAGSASIHSTPGQGTRVRLFFPAATGGAAAAAPAMGVNRQLGKSILLVEDNNEVADALVMVLQALGCTVTRVDRAHLAREWLAAQIQLPDLMLSDVMMPGDMDGLALAKFARSTYPSLNILLMTGYAEQMDNIAKSGFDVLPKPCSAEVLAEGIRGATTEKSPADPDVF